MAKFPLAIQVYTVREELKKDFKGTMIALAAMGYQGVELGGDFGGMEPAQLAAFLASLGLAVPGIHGSTADISNPHSRLYDYVAATSAPYVSTSRDRDVETNWDKTVDEIRAAAEAAKSKGVQFTYHNHMLEFKKFGGKYALDILFERTDPKTVQAEMDTYWIKRGGEDPVAYIRKYKGRVPEIHLKDMDPADQFFTEVGNGNMDLPGIYKAAEYVGTKWIIVEQDRWKRPPMDSARISIDNLKKAGLA